MSQISNTRVRGSAKTLNVFAAAFGLALILAAPAAANTITFAQYFEQGGGQQWTVTNNGSNTITISASGTEFFEFSNTATPFDGDLLTATFTLNATSTTAGNCNTTCGANDPYNENGYHGTFSFLATGDTGVGIANGTNLLSGTFNTTLGQKGATLSSAPGSGSATLQDSTDPTNTTQLVFTSAILSFASQTSENASYSLSSVNPNFSLRSIGPPGCGASPLPQCTAFPGGTGNTPDQFSAAGTGTFATAPGFVPEPGSMTLIGLGLCGIAVISRRLRIKAVAR